MFQVALDNEIALSPAMVIAKFHNIAVFCCSFDIWAFAGKYEEADQCLAESLEKDPNHVETLINQIVISQFLGKGPDVSGWLFFLNHFISNVCSFTLAHRIVAKQLFCWINCKKQCTLNRKKAKAVGCNSSTHNLIYQEFSEKKFNFS